TASRSAHRRAGGAGSAGPARLAGDPHPRRAALPGGVGDGPPPPPGGARGDGVRGGPGAGARTGAAPALARGRALRAAAGRGGRDPWTTTGIREGMTLPQRLAAALLALGLALAAPAAAQEHDAPVMPAEAVHAPEAEAA